MDLDLDMYPCTPAQPLDIKASEHFTLATHPAPSALGVLKVQMLSTISTHDGCCRQGPAPVG